MAHFNSSLETELEDNLDPYIWSDIIGTVIDNSTSSSSASASWVCSIALLFILI